MGVTNRAVPFCPTSARSLEPGDLIAVPALPSGWSCLMVLEVRPNSRTAFYVALLDWHGDEPPNVASVASAPIIASAMTRVEIFTEGHLNVVDTGAPVDPVAVAALHDYSVGATSKVWGWRAAIKNASQASTG